MIVSTTCYFFQHVLTYVWINENVLKEFDKE